MAKRPFFPRQEASPGRKGFIRQKAFTPPKQCRCPNREANKVRKNLRNILGPHPSGNLTLPPQKRWAYQCPHCQAVISWADDERTRAVIDFFRPLGMAPIYSGDRAPNREGN